MNHKNPRTHPTYPFKMRQGDTLNHSPKSDQIVLIYCTHTSSLFRKEQTSNVQRTGEKISSYVGKCVRK